MAEKVAELHVCSGIKLAKIDVISAYRIIPVHLDNRPLLGTLWQGCLYIDALLTFGLHSVPKLFNVIADVLEWMEFFVALFGQLCYYRLPRFRGIPLLPLCSLRGVSTRKGTSS